FVHFTTVDALDREHVEDDGFEIDWSTLCGNSKDRDLRSVAHVQDHVGECQGVAGHLEADVESFGHLELLLHFGERCVGWIDGQGGLHFSREVEAEGIEIGDDDVARASVAHNRDGHDANGAGAGDQHIFAEYREREGGMDSVAEGTEDGSDLKVDAGMMAPD